MALTQFMTALDVIPLVGMAGSGLSAFKAFSVARSASSRSLLEILKGMTRAERKRQQHSPLRGC